VQVMEAVRVAGKDGRIGDDAALSVIGSSQIE
jgi:hypothetical protein